MLLFSVAYFGKELSYGRYPQNMPLTVVYGNETGYSL